MSLRRTSCAERRRRGLHRSWRSSIRRSHLPRGCGSGSTTPKQRGRVGGGPAESALDRNRTCGLPLRRRSLYPTELRGQIVEGRRSVRCGRSRPSRLLSVSWCCRICLAFSCPSACLRQADPTTADDWRIAALPGLSRRSVLRRGQTHREPRAVWETGALSPELRGPRAGRERGRRLPRSALVGPGPGPGGSTSRPRLGREVRAHEGLADKTASVSSPKSKSLSFERSLLRRPCRPGRIRLPAVALVGLACPRSRSQECPGSNGGVRVWVDAARQHRMIAS
jgi:hypothetical protein